MPSAGIASLNVSAAIGGPCRRRDHRSGLSDIGRPRSPHQRSRCPTAVGSPQKVGYRPKATRTSAKLTSMHSPRPRSRRSRGPVGLANSNDSPGADTRAYVASGSGGSPFVGVTDRDAAGVYPNVPLLQAGFVLCDPLCSWLATGRRRSRRCRRRCRWRRLDARNRSPRISPRSAWQGGGSARQRSYAPASTNSRGGFTRQLRELAGNTRRLCDT